MAAVLLIAAAAVLLTVPAQFLCTVHSEGQTENFSILDAALQHAADKREAVVVLSLSSQAFEIAQFVSILGRVTLEGESQSVTMYETVSVEWGAELSLRNVTLQAGSYHARQRVFDVRGNLHISHLSISLFRVPFLWLYGTFTVSAVTISQMEADFVQVKAGGASVTASNVVFSQCVGAVIEMSEYELINLPTQISVSDSLFADSYPNSWRGFFQFTYRATATITSSHFHFPQQGHAMTATGDGTNCTLTGNLEAVVYASYLTNAFIRFSNCTFMDNVYNLVGLYQTEAEFVIEDSTILRQLDGGVIYAENSGTFSGQCHVSLIRSHIADFNLIGYSIYSANVMVLTRCQGIVTDVSINNVIIKPSGSYWVSYLFEAQFGQLAISQLRVKNSGGYFVVVSIGSVLYMSDFRMDNPYSASGSYVAVVQSTIVIQNGHFTQGSKLILPYKVEIGYPTIYIGVSVSSVAIRNVTIEDSIVLGEPCIGIVFSTFTVENVVFQRVTTYAVFLFTNSLGSLSGMVCDSVTDSSLFSIFFTHGELTMHSLSFTNSRLITPIGIFQSSLNLNNLELRNCSSSHVLIATHSLFHVDIVNVDACVVNKAAYLLENSQVELRHSQISSSVISLLVEAWNNVTTVAESRITSVYFSASILEADFATVTFADTAFVNTTASIDAGKLRNYAAVTFERCSVDSLHVAGQLGWQLRSSSLAVLHSLFRDFDVGLFQAIGSNLSIVSSQFIDGFNPVLSLKSLTAFGAVLSCSDCPFVSITDTRFGNVSALAGGAVAVQRKKSTSPLTVSVQHCTFVDCRARITQGGALFLQNVSFTVEKSTFIRNSAIQGGGAVFAALRPTQHAFIRHSHFMFNSALQGGALQWTNAEVQLVNVTFEANSASYGPDAASYGVTMHPRLSSSGLPASGVPLSLVFELRDHYGKIAKSSAFKYLVLQTTPSVHYLGNNITFLRNGVFDTSPLTIFAPPGSTQVIEAVYRDKQEDFFIDIASTVPIHFRNCVSGEVQHSDRCEYCPTGYFSFSPRDSNCTACPHQAVCPGGNQLVVNASYWREAWNSSVLLPCPFSHNCLGGINSTCADGYKGTLCAVCAQGYTNIRAVECVSCGGLLEFGKLGAAATSALLLRYGLLRYALHRPDVNKLFAGKVLVDYLQYLSAFSFLRLSYSKPLTWGLHAVNYLAVLLLPDLPLSCFNVTSPVYTKAVAGSLAFPGLLGAGFALSWLHTVHWRFEVSVLATSLLLYTPAITLSGVVPLLVCNTGEEDVLFFDTSEQCWSSTHMKYVKTLVLPSLILYLVAPVAVVVNFSLFRPQTFTVHFPLWMAGSKVPAWTVFHTLMKWLFVVTIVACEASNPLVQVTFGLIVLVVANGLTVSLKSWTYRSEVHFWMAQASLMAIAVQLGFVSYYLFSQPDGSAGETFVNSMLLLLLIVLVGIWTLLSSGRLLEAAARSDEVQRRKKGHDLPAPPNSPMIPDAERRTSPLTSQ